MPESTKNSNRDDRHARHRSEEDSELDGREAASLLYGGPDHSDNSTDTDSSTTDIPTDAPSE